MASRWVHNEVAFMLRMVASTVPSLRASAEQRSDFYLFKAQAYELLAATEPSIAAQALQIADKAMREAHAINLDF